MVQRLIPGVGYIDETRTAQALIPGVGYVHESSNVVAATALTLVGPTSGISGEISEGFIITANGTLAGDVIVTPSDNGGGGTFIPASITLTPDTTAVEFTYTATGDNGNRTLSFTNDSGLTNPDNVIYAVTALPTGNIVSETVDGQDISISLSTTNVPVSGQSVLVLSSDGVTVVDTIALTIGSGTANGTFVGVAPGSYLLRSTLTNAAGTTDPIASGNVLQILEIGGGSSEEQDLTVANCTTSNTSSTGSIVQEINIVVSSSTNTNSSSQVAISQIVNVSLTVSSSSQINSASAATITVTIVPSLGALNVTVVSNPYKISLN